MKLRTLENTRERLVVELSSFQLVPALACVGFICVPLVLFMVHRTFAALTPLLLFGPLGGLFLYFLLTRTVLVLDTRAGVFEVARANIVRTTRQTFRLHDISDIRFVANNPVRLGSTRSLEVSFKDGTRWRSLGTNATAAETEAANRLVTQLKTFLQRP